MSSVAPAVMSVFDIKPRFIGGTETYARELSLQLGRHGWRSVLCFVTPPPEEIARFLDLPNVSIELLHEDATRFNVSVMTRLRYLFRRHKPTIAHLHYVNLLSPYAWVARASSVGQVFFTDHSSRPENHRGGPASRSRRYLARAVNWPVSKVICVSDYGYRSLVERGWFPARQCERIYNGVDLDARDREPRAGGRFPASLLDPRRADSRHPGQLDHSGEGHSRPPGGGSPGRGRAPGAPISRSWGTAHSGTSI